MVPFKIFQIFEFEKNRDDFLLKVPITPRTIKNWSNLETAGKRFSLLELNLEQTRIFYRFLKFEVTSPLPGMGIWVE